MDRLYPHVGEGRHLYLCTAPFLASAVAINIGRRLDGGQIGHFVLFSRPSARFPLAHPHDNQGTVPVAGDTCMQCHKGEVRNWVIKNLIDTLVSQGRVLFNDIIEGKGSGACILLGGPPDTGKTLTAEIFAESTERPLLSVQAAQLGINPENVEKELNLVLQRGARFNAVILLDEADVYIRERGINLEQNAIVAAFLRTLETHNATLFLTTNRTGSVDDAIASRCLARIDYDMPTNDEQKPIWKILNNINQTGLSDHDIDTIVERHHQFSGRDIKQILKLASLWSSSKQTPVTTESIDFVAAFIPTRPFPSKNHPPQNETK